MIRGAEQPFKFTTSFDFNHICNIEAVFSQPYNDGSTSAPMPITKYYHRHVTEVESWDTVDKDTEKTYCVGKKYYRYDSNSRSFIASNTQPTESDILGGVVTTWPLSENCEKSKVYKCDESYYQYDPDDNVWQITSSAPNTDFIPLSNRGINNIPIEADKKKIYVYNRRYYLHDGNNWISVDDSTLPIEEIDYWGQEQSYIPSIDLLYNIGQCEGAALILQDGPNGEFVEETIETPLTLFVVDALPDIGIPSTNEYFYLYLCVSDRKYYIADEYGNFFDSVLTYEEVPIITSKEDYRGGFGGSFMPTLFLDLYSLNKIYYALETYYKYIDGEWRTFGRDCVYPTEVFAWNSEDTSAYDKSKIYMIKELYYQYNVETKQLEKTGVREVYYRYNAIDDYWEECEEPNIDVEEIELWSDSDTHDVSKTYVCKHIYYYYNKNDKVWEASKNMLIPIIEINEWIDSDYHDPSKFYMCPARYYKYNIEKEAWEEVDEASRPKIVNLDYWKDPIGLDRSQIYLCGPTYFQYASDSNKWASSASFNMQLTQIDLLDEATDQSKIYECSPIYYAYRGGDWESYKNVADAVRNDGFAPVDGDSKSFVTVLSAEETMRFNDKYKGCVQVTVYDDNINRHEKNLIEYFTVYPTLTSNILSNVTPSATIEVT